MERTSTAPPATRPIIVGLLTPAGGSDGSGVAVPGTGVLVGAAVVLGAGVGELVVQVQFV